MLVDCIWDEKSLQAVLAAGGVCTLGQKKERVALGSFYHFLEKIRALTFQNIAKYEYNGV